MPSPQQRLSRFSRAPDAAGSFQFTKRDLEILRHIAEHRFIRSEWIAKLVGGSSQQVLRRLHLLFHHGYLERPRAQLDYFHEGGSKSLVYSLASRGAGRLRRDLNMPFERMDWTTRNKRVGRLFIEHTLMVSDFMAALELDCRRIAGATLLHTHELPLKGGSANQREQFRWSVALPGRRRVAVVPDKTFALENILPDGRTLRTIYFLEADRGTMPIQRRDLGQSSVERKLKAYGATTPTGILRSNTGQKLRTVLITRSAERAQHILDAAKMLRWKDGNFVVLSADDPKLKDSPIGTIANRRM